MNRPPAILAVLAAALALACGSGPDGDGDVPVDLDFGPTDAGADPGRPDPGPVDPGPADLAIDAAPEDLGPCPQPPIDPACAPCDGTQGAWCADAKTACFCGLHTCPDGSTVPFTKVTACGVHRKCEAAKCVPHCEFDAFGDAGLVAAIRIGEPKDCPDRDQDKAGDSGLWPRRAALDAALKADLENGRYALAVEAVPGDAGFVLRLLPGARMTDGTFRIDRAALDPQTCVTDTWLAPSQWPAATIQTIPRDVPFRWPFLGADALGATLLQATLQGGLTVGAAKLIDAKELRLAGLLAKGDFEALMDGARASCSAAVCPVLTATEPDGPLLLDLELDHDSALLRDHLSVCLIVDLVPVVLTAGE